MFEKLYPVSKCETCYNTVKDNITYEHCFYRYTNVYDGQHYMRIICSLRRDRPADTWSLNFIDSFTTIVTLEFEHTLSSINFVTHFHYAREAKLLHDWKNFFTEEEFNEAIDGVDIGSFLKSLLTMLYCQLIIITRGRKFEFSYISAELKTILDNFKRYIFNALRYHAECANNSQAIDDFNAADSMLSKHLNYLARCNDYETLATVAALEKKFENTWYSTHQLMIDNTSTNGTHYHVGNILEVMPEFVKELLK